MYNCLCENKGILISQVEYMEEAMVKVRLALLTKWYTILSQPIKFLQTSANPSSSLAEVCLIITPKPNQILGINFMTYQILCVKFIANQTSTKVNEEPDILEMLKQIKL